MKIAKLVIGILTLVLSIVLLVQSCAAGIGNALEGSDSLSGSAGFILALCFIAGGIVGIAARNSRGGSIAAGIIYALGGIIAITATASNAGIFADLIVWSVLSLIIAVFFILSAFFIKRNTSAEITAPAAVVPPAAEIPVQPPVPAPPEEIPVQPAVPVPPEDISVQDENASVLVDEIPAQDAASPAAQDEAAPSEDPAPKEE